MQSKPKEVLLNGEHLTLLYPEHHDTDVDQLWQKHGEDERFFPYWLDSWVSAFGLSLYFKKHHIRWNSALEIGCGNGLLAQMIEPETGHTSHTDLVFDAVQFCSDTVPHQNRSFFCLDIVNPGISGSFDLIFGSDILYEDYLGDACIKLVDLHLHPQGTLIIADPCRLGKQLVIDRFRECTAFDVYTEKLNFTLNTVQQNTDIHIIKKA